MKRGERRERTCVGPRIIYLKAEDGMPAGRRAARALTDFGVVHIRSPAIGVDKQLPALHHLQLFTVRVAEGRAVDQPLHHVKLDQVLKSGLVGHDLRECGFTELLKGLVSWRKKGVVALGELLLQTGGDDAIRESLSSASVAGGTRSALS